MKKGLKIIFLLLLIIVIGAFWVTKNKSQNTPPSNPIKQQEIPVSKIILTYSFVKANQLPVIVAQKQGLFKKNNLDVEIKQVSKNVTSVIASGQADVTLGTPNLSLAAAVAGTELSWIGSINNDQGAVVVSTKDIKNIKSAGVLTGPAKTQTIGLLNLLGVNTEKITFQDMANNQARLIALKEKQVDVINAPKTDWLIFKKKANLSEEYKVLLDSASEEKAQMPIGIIVRNEFLKNNKTSVENFTKALLEANYWIKNNKEEFIKLLEANFSDIPKEDVVIEAESYFATIQNLQFAPTLEKGQEMLKLVEASNPKAKDYDLNKFINTSISDSLKNSGFLSQLGFN